MQHQRIRPDRVLELEIVPRVSRFAADDPRSLDEIAELYEALRSVVTVRTPPAPPGTKGVGETIGTILVALAALNPINGLVEAFKVWLNRDRTRRLDITLTTPDGRRELHLSANDMKSDEVQRWLDASWKKLFPDE